MSQTLDEFRELYLDEIKNDSRVEGMTPDEFFFTSMLDRLQVMGEITDPQQITTCVDKLCRNGRKMSIDAYSFDESDKSVVLYINDYIDSLDDAGITKTDIIALCNKMLYFLEEVYDNELSKYFDASNEILQIGRDIEKRLKRDYVDLQNDISIDRIKLFVITNKKLSERVKSFDIPQFKNKKVIVNVWSIQRIHELLLSGRDKEPVVVDVRNFGFNGIPCIKAEMSNATDYDAYLAIIPGLLLHKIYYEHGSRLLEGNVRAFLSVKGKVNKGIRTTILQEPTKFFTYNNGIACTADEIILDETGSNILKINDLQIINGGQTTASLTSAFLKNGSKLENIFVPLKLTVVKDDDYDAVISKISMYANSQNKVTDADMFSNHPFHRRFEDLAKKYVAPAKEGELYDTLWYYERSRGKYEQEKFKLTTKKQKDDFEKKRPRKQVVKKEELAKYYMAAHELRPDIVGKGSQKCMRAFATLVDNMFEANPEKFNEYFYKRMICYAILYRETDILVRKAEWYNVGGYKLNIVPYTISKLISMIPRGYCLDFNLIWRKQALPHGIVRMLKKLAYVTNEFIQKTANGVIVTEHCKKEETWKRYRDLDGYNSKYMADNYNFKLDALFYEALISKSIWDADERGSIKDEKLVAKVNIIKEIYDLGGEYWARLINEGQARRILSQKEVSIMQMIVNYKAVSEAQAKVIWEARKRLDNVGVLV